MKLELKLPLDKKIVGIRIEKDSCPYCGYEFEWRVFIMSDQFGEKEYVFRNDLGEGHGCPYCGGI